ncbi:MAG: 50S ribosomal protein L19 [Rickettsiales bacterium]|jgi:large subunit ribosomal protein L19|nr:50S ribosomal protein L19 [Rickettsiales bacterium]
MVNLLEEFNAKQVRESGKSFPDFGPGDQVKVSYKIIEGDSSRIQIFEGAVISMERSRGNFSSTFTVRKISHGVGVERKFPLYSPLVEKIEIVKKGIVRRSKLYYLRKLRGKSARIKNETNNPRQQGSARPDKSDKSENL